jgi:cytochrome c556
MSSQDFFGDDVDKELNNLDAARDMAHSRHLALESFIDALPSFPQSLNPFQLKLAHVMYGDSFFLRPAMEGFTEASMEVLAAITMEGLEELSRDKAKDIIKGSQSVMDWLYKVLDHLHETTDGFLAEVGEYEHRLHQVMLHVRTHVNAWPAAKGGFVYKSIPRNLSWKGKVDAGEIPKHLDEFLSKAYKIRQSCDSPQFHDLLKSMDTFEATPDKEATTKALDEVFTTLKDYLRTILPNSTSGPLKGLEEIEGRVLMYDPTEYLSGHRFYAYAPDDVVGAGGIVSSGISREDDESDLKQELPFLRPKEMLAILEVVKKHLHDYDDVERFKLATAHLRELQTKFMAKYASASRKRKDPVDPKPYVALMNIAAGLVYGMHVKALNKSVSVITAALRYVSKSVSALEAEHKAPNPKN